MNPTRLTTRWRHDGTSAVLEAHGEVDLATTPLLTEALAAAPADTDVIVDLEHVTFLDSTGVTALIVAHRATTATGNAFALAAATGPVQRVLDVSGVATVVPVFATVAAAQR